METAALIAWTFVIVEVVCALTYLSGLRRRAADYGKKCLKVDALFELVKLIQKDINTERAKQARSLACCSMSLKGNPFVFDDLQTS